MTSITAHHGTQTAFETFAPTSAVNATIRPNDPTAEPIRQLCETGGVWLTEDPVKASAYALGEHGRVLDVEIEAEHIVEVEWTDAEAVAEAIAANPQAIILLDREEILVLDLDALTITGGSKNCGCDLDEECDCWEAYENQD